MSSPFWRNQRKAITHLAIERFFIIQLFNGNIPSYTPPRPLPTLSSERKTENLACSERFLHARWHNKILYTRQNFSTFGRKHATTSSQPAHHQQTKLAWGTKNTLVTQKRRGKNKLRSKIRPPHLLSVAIVRLCLLPGRTVAAVVVLVIGVGTGAAVHSVNKPPPPNPLLTRPPSKTKHSGSGLR